MADERKIPDSAIDAGGKTDNVSADAINRNGINATETNDALSESREEQAKRLKEKKQASFEYADNYRQKLKKEAEERRLTPAQMRKKAEKEAMIAREKAEKEATIRQAIEREKEEARERAERAASLRDQVEKSLAEKKAQEEAEKEVLERAQEQAVENAPAEEPVAEDVAEEPIQEPATEEVEEEPSDEYDSDDEEEELDEDYDDDGLSGFTFDFDEDDDDMTFTFDYDDEDEDEEENEDASDDDMILTFDADDIIYNYEKQPKKKAAKKVEEPAKPEESASEVTVEDEPAPMADKSEAAKPAQTPKKKKKASSAPAPKKAVAMPKPAAKKPAARPAHATPKAVPQPIAAPVAEPVSNGMDERIAELLEENKQLLRENIDELRRKQAELEQRQAALESAAPAQNETDDTATPAEVSMPEPSDDMAAEPVDTDEKPASYVPEEVIRPSAVIRESAPAKSATRSEVKKIEEIPESELILNYVGEEAPENLNSAAAVYGLISLPPVSLRKKIRDNDRLTRKLERKLTKEKRDYRRAKTKEEKLEHIADCAEYQRAILDFDAESLAASALLGNDYTTRKKYLRRDVGEYNAFAQKLEDMSTTQIPQAPATMPDDVVLGNPYKRLPAVTTANLADNDASDPGTARNKDATPMSYVSQLDNDDDSITGISGRPAGSKGAKKKHALVKGEVKKGANELRQKMRSNGKLLKENRKDLRNELEAANKSGFAEKTEHMVSGLNYQREIIAVLSDSYEAAVRTHDKAEAKRISRQIDKEVSAYNKLGRAVEKRTGEPIPAAFNTFAKDLADNREMKLPPVVKYGQATTEGSFTDSEDVLVIKRVDFAEQDGSAKIVQVGSKKQKSSEELSTITVIDEPASAVSVTPPAEAVTVTPPAQAATLTPTVQTLKRSSDKKSYELKDETIAPVAPSAQTAVYIEPIIIGHPIESPQVNTPLRPMSERIVENGTTAKKIGSRSGRSDGTLPTVTLYDEEEAPASRISEKKSAKSVKAERPSKPEKAKKEEKVVYTLVEDTDHVKVFKADPTLKVVPRYDKVPLEEREVQVIKLKRVAEEPDSAKIIKANVPGVVPADETFDFIPIVPGAESAKEEITEEPEVEAKEVLAERDFEPDVFRSSGESGADEIGKKKLRKETSEREEKQEDEVKDAADEAVEEPVAEESATEEAVEEPVAEESAIEEVAEESVVEESATEEAVDEPVAEESVTEETAEEPAAEELATEETVEEPAAEEAATEEVAEEPAAEESATEEAVEEPAAEEPATEETAEEQENETEQELPALVNYNKEENLPESKEEQPEDKEPKAKRTVVEQPESAKDIEGAVSEPKEQKAVQEEADSAKVLEGKEPEVAKVVLEAIDSAKILEGKEPEEPKVVSEDADSAKLLEGTTADEHKVVTEEEDSAKILESIGLDADGQRVVSEEEDSAKIFEAITVEAPEEEDRVVAEEADSTKVLEGKEPEERKVVIDETSAKVLDGTTADEHRVVTEEADSAKVFDAVIGESEAEKVVLEEADSTKVLEGKEPKEPKVVSEEADSAKVLDGTTTDEHKVVVIDDDSAKTLEAIEQKPEQKREVAEETDSVKILEGKESKTATKGYILTENTNEAKIIQGNSRVYTLTEEPDSAKRFEATPVVKREVAEKADSVKIISANEALAPKTVGAYKIVEESPLAKATEEAVAEDTDEIVHVGEEVVTVIEDEVKPNTAPTADEHKVVSEGTDSAKILEGKEPEEARVVLEAIDSAKVLEGKKLEEPKVVSEETDSAKVFEKAEFEPEEYKVVVDDDSIKVLEAVEFESEEPRVVSEQADSAKVFDAITVEAPEQEDRVVVEESDSTKVLEGTEPEAEEHKVIVIDDDSAKTLEATEQKPEQKRAVSELLDSAKVLEGREPKDRKVAIDETSAKVIAGKTASGKYTIAEEPIVTENMSEESEETLESIPEESDEIVYSGEETVTVLEDAAPQVSEEVEEKEPKTATKGYILSENSNETKIIQGKSRVYTLTEEPDSAKRFEATAPTEIVKSGYSITEDHEAAKVFSAAVSIKREVVEDASGARIIPAAESESVVVRIITESEGSEKIFDAKASEPIEERTVTTAEDSAKIIEAVETEKAESRVVLEKIDSAKVLDGSAQTLTEDREITEAEDSAKVIEADASKSKVSRGYTLTVDPKSAKIVEGRPELKYTVSVDESGRRTVTAELARAVSEDKHAAIESDETAKVIEEASVSEVSNAKEHIEAAPEYSSLSAISDRHTEEILPANDENVAETVADTEKKETSAELEIEPQLMAVEFDGSIPEIIEEYVPSSDELTAESGESIEATNATIVSETAAPITEENSEISDSEPLAEHTVTVMDTEEAQASEKSEVRSEEKPKAISTVKGVSEIPDSAKVLLGKVKRAVDEEHDAIKVIAGAPLRVVNVDTDAAKVIPASENTSGRSGAYVIKQQNRTPDGKLMAEDENDVLSVQGESVEVGEEASSYEYKIDDIDVEVPEDFEASEADETIRSGSDAGTVTEIVDESEQENILDANVELTDDGRITIAEKPTYRLTESTREQAEADAKANIPLESLVTSRYTIEEHLPKPKPTEPEPIDETAEAEREVAEEKPEGSYIIKQYAPLARTDEQSDAECGENKTDARRPEQIVIYGKSKEGARASETEELENRELSAPKAKGAYTLLEGTRVKKPVEDTEDYIVHVGEETVEVIEDAPNEEYATLTSDTAPDEAKPEKARAEISDTIVVSEGADTALRTVRESDSAKVIPAADVAEKTDGDYIITENSAETKRFEATVKGYTLTEEPDSAKRFEASEPVEIENGKYVITVSPEAARTIEGRPELKYTVAVDEDGKKTVKANIADESKSGEYRIVEDKDGVRVLSGIAGEERHVVENARASEVETDVTLLVKPEPAPTYDAEHTAELMEEAVSENYVTLTSDTELPEGKPHVQKTVGDTIVVNEKPKSEKGYTIEIDESARLTISARESADTERFARYGVAEQDGSAKVVPSFTIINAPKSRDAYVITEDRSNLKTIGAPEAEAQARREIRESDGKVIGAVETEAQARREIRESDGMVIGAVEAEAQAKREIRESDGKIIGATERSDARKVTEALEDTRVISSATDTSYEIAIRTDDAHAVAEEQSERVVSEIENPKELLKTNKVLNTKRSQNNYAILESRDTKVISAPAEEPAEEEAKPIGAVYTLGVEEGKTIPATEDAAEAPQQAYRISTDEEHRKILEAIETLKRANYDVSEIERAENMIHAAKVLNTKSDDNTYAIVESRDVKVISSAESTAHEGEYGVTERAGTERIIEATTAQTEESHGYEIRETAQEPKTIEAKVINASKSRDSYVIMENRGSEKVIPEASAEETAIEEAQRYEVYEKLGTEKTVLGTDITPEVKYEVSEIASTGIIIPEGTKILNAEKGGDRYIIAEHRASEGAAVENVIHNTPSVTETYAQPTGYSINESADPYVVTQRKINRHGKPMVYEVGGAHVVAERKKLHEVKDPLVFEQVGTEKVISNKDFKLPAKPLVYEEIGTQKIVKSESSMRKTLKDSIVEYKGTEMVVKGKIPVVDILIDPYKNTNMGVLAIGDLKKYLSENDKEIAKLKYHFRYAKKTKVESERSAEKIMAHIAMINNQCLICERYVERISVCNNAESKYYAEKGAAMLRDELKRYNDLITEYNLTTSSKIPLADKTLPKRVLAGEAYEHLTRISYNLINEQVPMKTSKKFSKKKKGSDKPAAKIIEQKRYLADIKLIERCDNESANDILMVQNRYDFESALLKGERDMMSFKFAKSSKKNATRKLYINRKLKSLKKAKAKAVRYESLDNERYYRVLACDTSLESYKNNNSKKKKVTKIVTEVGKLLKERDDINTKLNTMYAGTLADISGAGDGEKWRSVKAASAKKHSRKLRGKANALKRSVPGFGEKKAERIHMFNSLLDAKVEAQSTIDLCKYRLRREKNKLADKMSIRKDIREARKRIRIIDREIKERRKLILDEHYGPDASFELTALIGMCVLGVIGVAWLAKSAGIDVVGIVKPYIQQWMDSIGAASPAIKSVIDMIKGYLM